MAESSTANHVNAGAHRPEQAPAQQQQQQQQELEEGVEREQQDEQKPHPPPNGDPTPLGPHLRLRVRKPADLPWHAALSAQQAQGQEQARPQEPASPSPDLRTFVLQLLDEANSFIADLPRSFSPTGTTASCPSAAKVEQLVRTVSRAEWAAAGRSSSSSDVARPEETWFARRSRHVDAASGGTAAWAEFDAGLRVAHSRHEKEYTPNVFDAREVLDWDEELGREFPGGAGGRYEDVSMSVYEMAHAMPFPLKNRVFSTLVISARTSPTSLIDLQVPVDLSAVPSAFYSNGKHLKEGATAQQKKRVIVGEYVSVERAMVVENGGEDGKREIQWDMATASDAGGGLPMWMQKMGVPGAIAKDVGFFIEWARKQRAGSS